MTAKELAETAGLFITDLEGVLQEKMEELSPEEKKRLAKLLQQASVVRTEETRAEPVFFYDEWDYLINDYRPRWCQLREILLEGDSSELVHQIRKEHSALITAVRRHFQRIRPEMLRRVKRLRDGEEIDLNDAIEAVIDRKAGLTPSDRIYQNRERKTRDVATAFLLDLSASTDEWLVKPPNGKHEQPMSASRGSLYDIFGRGPSDRKHPQFRPSEDSKRVIDLEREALVIMAEALEDLGDEYAIYGFSGYGRDNVEFFPIKDFSEAYSEQARCRIGAIKPCKSTRMGPAIRHTLDKLERRDSRLKVLILLSDGYPQDFDYGPDRTSRDYGLHDTAVALQEAKRRSVHTFCVTVDQAGNDYLREMCGGENYLVVKRPGALPRILPQVYRGLTV
jgi:nitric oxide reductase activation protein